MTVYNAKMIEDEIRGVAESHLTPHGATYDTIFNRDGVLVTVSFKGGSFSHYTRLSDVPEAVQGEVMHCAMHYMSMTLLQHVYRA